MNVHNNQLGFWWQQQGTLLNRTRVQRVPGSISRPDLGNWNDGIVLSTGFLMLQCPNHRCIPNQSMCRCIFPGQSSGISIESLPRLNPHSCIPSSPLRLVSHAGDYGDQRRSKVGWWHHSERWDQGWHDSSRPRNFMQQNARPRNMRSMKEP